jgi:CubicO group peptidase (beta-lactamase class C family)
MSLRFQFALALYFAFSMQIVQAAGIANREAVSAEVDAAVLQQMNDQKIPGIGLAVVINGHVVKANGYGLANIELGTPISPGTVFEAGSITKQFTASAIMLLAEDGKIRLDDSISKYFPEAPPALKAVTVRHLLTHTSGIPDVSDGTDETNGIAGVVDFHREYTEDQLAHAYLSQTLTFQPGTRWSYCNACYELLGFLIHRVTGESYADFLHARVFVPLGMSTARAFSHADIIPNRASGYTAVNGAWKNAPQWWSESIMSNDAAGGLWMTVLDLAKWDAALYSDKIIKQSSLKTMWTPVPIDDGSAYPGGMGWFIAKANGHRIVFHTNGGPGSSGVISRYLDDRLTIIVMTNLGAHHTDVMKVAGKLADLYLPDTKGANPVKDW